MRDLKMTESTSVGGGDRWCEEEEVKIVEPTGPAFVFEDWGGGHRDETNGGISSAGTRTCERANAALEANKLDTSIFWCAAAWMGYERDVPAPLTTTATIGIRG